TYYRVHGNNISTTKRQHMFSLLTKLNRRILIDLNIGYSESELEVHSKSLHYDLHYFSEKGKITELEKWISRFLTEIEKNQNYNSLIVYKILMKRYIVLCNNSKNYKKLFLNRLISRHPLEYLTVLYKKIIDRI
ncbi:MAG: hypothetical protein M3N30_00400, partial [Bacteroidota bacterium]|nr:hypothetical protein [Bacteroidota bacterium]